jgi:hypothetical protein
MGKTRGKNKIQDAYTMKDMYNDYISDKIEGTPYYITFKDYLNICGRYYKEISRLIIYESKTFKLPFRLGSLTVVKKKPKFLSLGIADGVQMCTLSIDWKESKIYDKWIPHMNDHSGGFKFRFLWSKQQCFAVNGNFYRLVFSRTNKRELAKVIKSGNTDYLEI